MGLLNENSVSNNLDYKNNQKKIYDNIQVYNNSKDENTSLPEPSNYGSFTQNELNNEYLLARYPNGIINIFDTVGNPHKNKTTNINLNSTINKNTSNTSVSPTVNVSFPTQTYTYESFSNINDKKKYNNNLFYLIILLVLFILWLIKIKK